MKQDSIRIAADSQAKFNNNTAFCIGTGRMGLALQREYQQQLAMAQAECAFTHIRGHGLFSDDMAIYQPYQDAEGNWEVVAVSSGFVEMINNRAKLFCLTVERPEEIDIRRAEEARDRAEEQLRQQQSIVEYHRSQAALARAMTRLRVTKELK